MRYLLILLALVAFVGTSFAQGVQTVAPVKPGEIAILPLSATGTAKIPFARFNPTLPSSKQANAKTEDTLRGPLATLSADTSVWMYLPSTYLTYPSDSVGMLCLAIGGPLLDTASISARVQYGVNGVPDTTAAVTDQAWGATDHFGGAKASATKGFYVSTCIPYGILAAQRGNNCWRVITSHQVANNASAAMSQTNMKEVYDITATYQLPSKLINQLK